MPSTKISMCKEKLMLHYVIYNCLQILLFPFSDIYSKNNYERLEIRMSIKIYR